MSQNVFANGREISAKKDGNQSPAAMPDVCLSPPSPPAGPVPIPYPNTAMASDTNDGSKTVKIGGDEVGLKNSSDYKKSNGDEAATKSLGMGIVSHNIQGKMKHAAWSFDVKVEDANAIRHMDMTTHNHMNQGNMALTLNQAKMKIAAGAPLNCEELDALNQEARNNEMQPGKTSGFTLTTGSYKGPGGGSFYMKAVTPRAAATIKPGSRSGYMSSNKKTTMACSNEKYGGRSNRASGVENNKTRNHTEPKMIESIFGGGGGSAPRPPGSLGTLTMKINHQETTPPDAMPCDSCKKAICVAVDCGLTIKLCNKDNDPVDPPCSGQNPMPESEWTRRGLGA
jgi:hypothetical protein